MATIIRQSYIDKIERFLGKETIIVLVGQRRVGKSCMMKQYLQIYEISRRIHCFGSYHQLHILPL